MPPHTILESPEREYDAGGWDDEEELDTEADELELDELDDIDENDDEEDF